MARACCGWPATAASSSRLRSQAGRPLLKSCTALFGDRVFEMTQRPFDKVCDAPGTSVVCSARLDALSGESSLSGALAGLADASVVLVSLPARGSVRGALTVIRPAGQRSDDALLRQLGDRLALAIDNARLIEVAEAELARAKESDAARLAGEATISVVARAGPILLFACDADGTITLMDGGLLTQFQLRPESLVGKPFLEVFGGYAVIADHAKRALEGEPIRRAQIPFEGRNLEAWAQPLRAADGSVTGFAGIVVDVSARVSAETAVLDAARRQAALVEHASDVIIVLTGDGTIHYVNPACQRVLGYAWRAGDVIDVLSLIHPDDRELCREQHPGGVPPLGHPAGGRLPHGACRRILAPPRIDRQQPARRSRRLGLRGDPARRDRATRDRGTLARQRRSASSTCGSR